MQHSTLPQFKTLFNHAFAFQFFPKTLSRLLLLQQIFGYEAGVDYPAYDKIPSGLTFRCSDRQPGYYADIETRCQVWHWCLPTGYMFSFLCPNGTVFNQVSLSVILLCCPEMCPA